MYKLNHLLTFRAVHRTGSFALAARELSYTASAVSQQIAALEREAGLVLFEREAHGVRATAAADRVADVARRFLAALDEFDREIREIAAGRGVRLVLGSFPTASVALVPAVLAAFSRRLPQTEPALEEGEPDVLIDGVSAGEIDVALVYEYGLCPREWPPDLTARPLVRENLYLLDAGPDAPAGTLEHVRDRAWITSLEGSAGALSLNRLCAAAGFAPRISHRSNDYDVVRELVIATGAVAVVPGLGHSPDPRLSATALTPHRAYRDVLLVHRTRNQNPLLTAFLEAVTEVCPARPDR